MHARAVVLHAPERIAVESLALDAAGPGDVVVDVAFSGISTGTERLLWSGRMPHFPGMGYPLVPGYESVGRVTQAGPASGLAEGDTVFVPGARCFGDVRGLFGGAASRVVLPGARALKIDESLGERGALLALAATARHCYGDGPQPELVIGHGVLGRMVARLAVLAGAAPTVWEVNPARRDGASGYAVVDPDEDPRRDYARVCDVSGDCALIDALVQRLAPGGEIVLAGFYDQRLSFAFAPAFMREARLRVAAQWSPADLVAVRDLAASGALPLDGLVTHRRAADDAAAAYATAFDDSDCLKMLLDWRARP